MIELWAMIVTGMGAISILFFNYALSCNLIDHTCNLIDHSLGLYKETAE